MRRVVLAVALAGLVVTGCGSSDHVPTGPAAPADATEPGSRPVPVGDGLSVERGAPVGQARAEPGIGEVLLWVSNQSFEDDPVDVTVSIDGTEVISQAFRVEDQHNWIPFVIRGLAAGQHTITATSGTGAEHAGAFTLPPAAPRWLVLDYWHHVRDPAGRHFTLTESERPVAFA